MARFRSFLRFRFVKTVFAVFSLSVSGWAGGALTLDSISGQSGTLSDTININYTFADPDSRWNRVDYFKYSIGDTSAWIDVPLSSLTDTSFRLSGSYSFGWKSKDQLDSQVVNPSYVKFALADTVGAWSMHAPLPDTLKGSAVEAVNGKIYVIGGHHNVNGYSNACWEYNPPTNTWTPKSDMPSGIAYAASAVVNNKIYVIGGFNGIMPLNTVLEYDPALNIWMPKNPLTAMRFSAAAAVVSNKIYIMGGTMDGANYLPTVEEFDPALNSHAARANMTTPRGGLGAEAVNGIIYAMGGQVNAITYVPTVEAYNPSNNTWSPRTPMPTLRGGLASAESGGKIYAIGGFDSWYKSQVEKYNPSLDVWVSKDTMPTPRNSIGAAVVNGDIFIIGGYANGQDLAAVEGFTPIVHTNPVVSVPLYISNYVDIFPPDNDLVLSAAAIDTNKVVLMWNPGDIDSADADSVGIWYKPGAYPDSMNDPLAVLAGKYPISAYIDTVVNLGTATAYYFSLRVRDSSGNWSNASANDLAVTWSPDYPTVLVLDSVEGETGMLSDTLNVRYTFTDSEGDSNFVANFAYSIGDTSSWNSVSPGSLFENDYGVPASRLLQWNTRLELDNQEYDPVYIKFRLGNGDWWTSRSSMGSQRFGASAASLNGFVYVFGGNNGSNTATAERYDLNSDTWEIQAAMPTARYQHRSCTVNGVIYVIGGLNGPYQNAVEVFNPATQAWTVKAPMPTARSGFALAEAGGRIYAFGGGNGSTLAIVEEYDPLTNAWTPKTSMPTPRNFVSAAAFNGKIYVMGGFNGVALSTVEEYDPASDTWTAKADLPTARRDLVCAAVNGRIYAIGGIESAQLKTVEEYDPISDTWQARADLLTAREAPAAAVLAGKIFIMGGYMGSPLASVEEYTPFRYSNEAVSTALHINNKDITPPDNDLLLGVAVLDTDKVVLSWNPSAIDSADADTVGIWYKTISSPDSAFDVSASLAGLYRLSDSIDTITGLSPGTEYFFSLFVRDTAGNWSGTTDSGSNETATLQANHPAQLTLDSIPGSAGVLMGTVALHFTFQDPENNTGSIQDLAYSSGITGPWTAVPLSSISNNNIRSPGSSAGTWNSRDQLDSLDADPFYLRFAVGDTSGAWSIHSALTSRRSGFAAAEVNGKIYVIGGWEGDPTAGSPPLSTVEEYDPVTRVWTSKAPMPTARGYLAASAINGKIYAAGGYNGTLPLNTLEEYNPATDIWTAKAPMANLRNGPAAAVYNGRFYVCGGLSGITLLTQMEEYNPVSNTWTAKAPMMLGRTGLTAAVAGDKLYAIGGYNGAVYLAVVEEYDLLTNTWTVKSPLQQARGMGAAMGSSGRLLIFGGYNDADGYLSTVEQYNAGTNSWFYRKPMPHGRNSLAAVLRGNSIHLLGGHAFGEEQDFHETFTPSVYSNYAVSPPLHLDNTYDTSPPDNDISLRASAIDTHKVVLTWNPGAIDSTDADSVGIWYRTGAAPASANDPASTLAGIYHLGTVADTITSLQKNQVYYFSGFVRDYQGNWSTGTGDTVRVNILGKLSLTAGPGNSSLGRNIFSGTDSVNVLHFRLARDSVEGVRFDSLGIKLVQGIPSRVGAMRLVFDADGSGARSAGDVILGSAFLNPVDQVAWFYGAPLHVVYPGLVQGFFIEADLGTIPISPADIFQFRLTAARIRAFGTASENPITVSAAGSITSGLFAGIQGELNISPGAMNGLLGGPVFTGADSVPILHIVLSPDMTEDMTLDSMVFTLLSGSVSKIDQLVLIADINGNGILDPGPDTVVSSDVFGPGNTVRMGGSPLGRINAGAARSFLVLADFSASPLKETSNLTFRAEIAGTRAVGSSSRTVIPVTGSSITSRAVTGLQGHLMLSAGALNDALSVPLETGRDSVPVLHFRLSADAVETIRVDSAAIQITQGRASRVAEILVVLDTDSNGIFTPGAEPVLASVSMRGDSAAVFETSLLPPLPPGTSVSLLALAGFNAEPMVTGDDYRFAISPGSLRAAGSRSLTSPVISGAAVNSPIFPARQEGLALSPGPGNPLFGGPVFSGTDSIPVLNFVLTADSAEDAGINAVQIILAEGDTGKIQGMLLIHDQDADGTFNPAADAVLAFDNSLSGGMYGFSGSYLRTVPSGTAVSFLVLMNLKNIPLDSSDRFIFSISPFLIASTGLSTISPQPILGDTISSNAVRRLSGSLVLEPGAANGLLGGAVVAGTDSTAMMQFRLKAASIEDIQLNTLSFRLLQGDPSKTAGAVLVLDKSPLGVFSAADTVLAAGTIDSTGLLRFARVPLNRIKSGGTVTYLLLLNLNETPLTQNDLFQFDLVQTGITASGGSSLGPVAVSGASLLSSTLSWDFGKLSLAAGTGNSRLGGWAATGQDSIPVLHFTLKAGNNEGVNVNSIKIRETGGNGAVMEKLILVRDVDGGGTWNPGADIVLSASPFDALQSQALFSSASLHAVPQGGTSSFLVLAGLNKNYFMLGTRLDFRLDSTGITGTGIHSALSVPISGKPVLSVPLRGTHDTTAPVITFNGLRTTDQSPQLQGTIDDPRAGVTVTFDTLTFPALNNGDGFWTLPQGALPVIPQGIYIITAAAADSFQNESQAAGELIIDFNDPPYFSALPETLTVYEDSAFNFMVETADPDTGDELGFIIPDPDAVPKWLRFDGSVLSGTPGNGDVGTSSFSLVVSDGSLNDTAVIRIQVINTNDPPVFTQVPDTIMALEDARMGQILTAADPDAGDSLRYSLSGPAWLEMRHDTLTGIPQNGNVGYVRLSVFVSDGKVTDTAGIVVAVFNVNDPPVLQSLKGLDTSAQTWKEDSSGSFTVTIADPDAGDLVGLDTSSLPGFISLSRMESGNGKYIFRFSVAPLQKDTGSLRVSLAFSDTEQERIVVGISAQVLETNDPPLAVVPKPDIRGGAVRFSLDAKDEDGTRDEMSFRCVLTGSSQDTLRDTVSRNPLLDIWPLLDNTYQLSVSARDRYGLEQKYPTVRSFRITGISSITLDSGKWVMAGILADSMPTAGFSSGTAIFQWSDKSTQSRILDRYIGREALPVLKRGSGFWIRTDRPFQFSVTETDVLQTASGLNLTKGDLGWNQVSNPYPYPIDVSKSGLVFWKWDPGKADVKDVGGILQPWQAYWVQAQKDTRIDLINKPWFGASTLAKKTSVRSNGAEEWTANLILKAGKYEDQVNPFGVRSVLQKSAADIQPNLLDPPKMGPHVSLFFTGSDAETGTRFTSDFRSAIDGNEEWFDFGIRNSGTGEKSGELALEGTDALLEDGKYVFLVNQRQAVPVGEGETLEIPLSGQDAYYAVVISNDPLFPEKLKTQFDLAQNFPNPVRFGTSIRFSLPYSFDSRGLRTSSPQHVKIRLFSMKGKETLTLLEKNLGPGAHLVQWRRPVGLPSGTYIYRIEADGWVSGKKMLLLR